MTNMPHIKNKWDPVKWEPILNTKTTALFEVKFPELENYEDKTASALSVNVISFADLGNNMFMIKFYAYKCSDDYSFDINTVTKYLKYLHNVSNDKGFNVTFNIADRVGTIIEQTVYTGCELLSATTDIFAYMPDDNVQIVVIFNYKHKETKTNEFKKIY